MKNKILIIVVIFSLFFISSVSAEECTSEGQPATLPYNCCPGLDLVADCLPDEACPISLRYCVDCGNGVCDVHENWYNCPDDCCETDEDCKPACSGNKRSPYACDNGQCVPATTLECDKECGAECESNSDCASGYECDSGLTGTCLCKKIELATDAECTSCQDCQNKINSASEGDIIRLASDISYDGPVWGTCIFWQNNGITFDCQNHLINGTWEKAPDYGIAILGGENNRIINCRMTNFLNSIYLKSSSHNEIAENEVLNGFGAACGIALVMNSCENRVVNNTVSNLMWGILVETDSNLNSLSGNKVSNCFEKGIFLALSSLNVLKNNQMVNNYVNLVFYEENDLEHYEHSIDMSNTVNGKPVKYCYYNKNSLSGISSNNCPKIIENMDIGHLTIAGGNNFVVKNNKVDNGDGINLAFTNNSEIHSNKLSNNHRGIYSVFSNYNEIRDNSISTNDYGIYFFNKSLSNNIINNTITDSYDGIHLQKNSDSNVIDNNKISSSNSGIRLSKCSSVHVIKNILLKNAMGIHLSNSPRSTLKSNNISEGYIGIYVYDSPLASITYNTIKNHVLDENNCPSCGTGIRIQMDNSGSATISNNLISYNAQGILIGDSHSHIIINNSILNNSDTGIYLFRGTLDNTVDGNRMCFNTKYDIHCQSGTSASGANVYNVNGNCSQITQVASCEKCLGECGTYMPGEDKYCCWGLEAIPITYGDGEICTTPAGYVCTAFCGDSVCRGKYENACSCPKDCKLTLEKPIETEISVESGVSTVSIEKISEDIILIKTKKTSAITSEKLTVEEDKLYVETSVGNKQVKILPEEASSKATEITVVKEIELKEESQKLIYSIKGTKQTAILFVIPVSMEVETKIDAETGDVVSVTKPWWSFLVW